MARVVLIAMLLACSPELPNGEIGCSDGRCPAGFTCVSQRCFRNDTLDADGIPDTSFDSNLDAGEEDVPDAFVPPSLEPAWIIYFGGTGSDAARGTALSGSELLVVGSLSPDAMFDGDAVDVPQREQGFLATIDEDGVVGDVHQWTGSDVTHLADVTTDGSAVYVAGSWFGRVDAGMSTGSRSGWVGTFDGGGFTNLLTLGGTGTQVATSIAVSGDLLLVGGNANGQLALPDETLATDDQDGVFVHMRASGTVLDTLLIDGTDAPSMGDRVSAVAFNTNGNLHYIAGRVTTDAGFDTFVRELGLGTFQDQRGGGGLVVGTSLVSTTPDRICVGGHFEGDLTFGSGLFTAVNDAGFVHCFEEGTESHVVVYDGNALDRVKSLAFGGGVMAVAGEYSSSDLDLGSGPHSAVDQDAFVTVIDPNEGTPIADAVFGGNGNLTVEAVEATQLGDQTRIYVVGSFSSQLTFMGETQDTTGAEDGFIAAFDLVR